jgi:hypothetical protein
MRPALRHLIVVVPLVLAVAACGSDDSGSGSSDGTSAPATDAADSGDTAADAGGDAANACPADGCAITILDVVRSGDELEVTWEQNFAPDLDRNHIHVYWDTYTADQVSSDAADRDVEQGEWVPIDAPETFVTEGAVSVAVRGDSTTVCVTASDGDHAVIDSSIVDCRDVSDLL